MWHKNFGENGLIPFAVRAFKQNAVVRFDRPPRQIGGRWKALGELSSKLLLAHGQTKYEAGRGVSRFQDNADNGRPATPGSFLDPGLSHVPSYDA